VSGAIAALADGPLRVGVLGGWFAQGAFPEVLEALDAVAQALDAKDRVILPGAQAARAAAFCLTPVEAAELHLPDLKTSAMDYDPAVRDRLLAGALLPASVAEAAQRYRTIFRDEVRRAFERFDILLAPSSVCPAPGIGQTTMEMGGQQVSVRKNLGAFTQPISYIGLPVLAAPVNRPGQLPIGVQIIAPAWREDLALAAGLKLQRLGVAAAHAPEGFQ
jgi:aspartyl-tRNA(Asn)/glutamyl-tRNA(Gln) amidotransferase subunit A